MKIMGDKFVLENYINFIEALILCFLSKTASIMKCNLNSKFQNYLFKISKRLCKYMNALIK